MTPDDLKKAIGLLTGDALHVAGSMGYSRASLYAMLAGRMRISAETQDALCGLLAARVGAIDELLARLRGGQREAGDNGNLDSGS